MESSLINTKKNKLEVKIFELINDFKEESHCEYLEINVTKKEDEYLHVSIIVKY